MSNLNPKQFGRPLPHETMAAEGYEEYEKLRSADPPYRLTPTPKPAGAHKTYEGPGAFHCDHPLCDGSQFTHENHEGGTNRCENGYCNQEEVAWGNGHCRGCAGVKMHHPELDDYSVATHPKWRAFRNGDLKP